MNSKTSMNLTPSASKGNGRFLMPARAPIARASRVGLQVIFAACLALLAGCSTTGTTVGRVWLDSVRAEAPLGKTLVVVLFPNPTFAIPIEQEWVRQLQGRGVEAEVINMPADKRPPDRQEIVTTVKAEGFNTVLVLKLLDVKKVERDVSSSEVAVVETKLYDTQTEQPFWSARSDTYMVIPGGDQALHPRIAHIRAFVEILIKEMARSNVL